MTALYPTPKGWPSILLGGPEGTAKSAKSGRGGGTGAAPAAPSTMAADPAAALDAATARGAFAGLRRAVHDLGPAGTIAAIAASGLRGRGGAGFPTAEKWRLCAATDAPRRYVVANGYGADPSAQTDRALIESNPFAVIEGVAIAAFAVGADEAFIAVRAEAAEVDPPPRGGDRRGRGRRPHRPRDARLRPRPDDPGPDGPGRLHARRGDGPPQGPRGQARPAGAAAAPPRGGRPVRHADRRPERPDPRGRFVDPGQRAGRLRRDRREGQPGHDSRRRARAERKRRRGGPARDTAPRDRRASQAARRISRRSSSAGRRAACCRPTCSTRPTSSMRSGRPAPTSARAPSSLPTSRACVVDLARLLTRFCADEACGKTIPCRIGTRRISEIGDRIATGTPRPTDGQLLDRPGGRRRRFRALRPRAAGDPSVHERNAILPVRARRAHPPKQLPCRCLSPDRGGGGRRPLR